MNSEQLIKIIDFWQKIALENNLYPRFLVDTINIKNKEVVDILGPRRSGKSSVMKLLIKKFPQNNFLYINFEDPFFIEHTDPEVITELLAVYHEYFGKNLTYLFFDEIQNIKNWEKAIRKLRDAGTYKIFVTGSSAKLLSRELSTLLSGRHMSYQLLPASFGEYLNFKGISIGGKKEWIVHEKKILKNFKNYLVFGGFPEVVLHNDLELLKQYYRDIFEKDIVARYDVRDKDTLEKMGIFLLSNSAKICSIASLKKLYGVSFVAVNSYVNYFKEAFLLFELPLFSYSLKTQHKAFKKIYAVDTGLANAVSYKFSEDKGRMLENAVFLQLHRMHKEMYYYKDLFGEIDFVVKDNTGKIELIQVVWEWRDEQTKRRELKKFDSAFKETSAYKATILTFADRGEVKVKNKKIKIMPVYEWILQSV